MFARIEALRRSKAHVIGIQRVGNDQMLFHPIGQIIRIGIGGIEKSAFLPDKSFDRQWSRER